VDDGRLAARFADLAPGLLREPEDLRGARRQTRAAGSERDATARAHEQVVAEVATQCGHRFGYRGLAHVQGNRGGLHRAQAGDHRKRLKLSEGHRDGES
jgi:hypothetical protein